MHLIWYIKRNWIKVDTQTTQQHDKSGMMFRAPFLLENPPNRYINRVMNDYMKLDGKIATWTSTSTTIKKKEQGEIEETTNNNS